NPDRKGVHDAGGLRKNLDEAFASVSFEKLGTVLITLAPELFAPEALRKLTARGAILSAGHSQADAAALTAAKAAGLTGITHLFNAMGPINAREPGLAGLALGDNDLCCSIIADGAHVAPEMLRLAANAKPPGKLFFVSDAMPPAGQNPPGDFTLYGKKIITRDGRCLTEEGKLAGAALTLFECVQKAVRDMGISLPQALHMASLYPARFLKIDKDYGSLAHGKRADFIAFDGGLNLQKVCASGNLA
ncbi:MAG TPA: amidohydrolase family protein, partial [Alphaproteobacteria bacterium]|nr:amidohydrolase family protein [Alphaproteobacteria bacterium]